MSQPKDPFHIPKDYAEPTGTDTQWEPVKSTEESTSENWKVFRIVLVVIMTFSLSAFLVQLLKASMPGHCP
jgi:hypothetical protein